jgi:hypothetical protein
MGCTKLRRQNVVWDATQSTAAERLIQLTAPKWLHMHVAAYQVIMYERNNIYHSYENAYNEGYLYLMAL